jgi:biopolymer transport protein ExbD
VRSTKVNPALFFALVATLGLAWATSGLHAQPKPGLPQGSTVFLPHLYRPDSTDCMGRSVFVGVGLKGVSVLTEPDHRFSDQQVDIISARIGQIMTPRQERVVYVLGDRDVTYGDVAMLIARLQQSTRDLNVILVSQADMGGLRSGLCLGVRVSQ